MAIAIANSNRTIQQLSNYLISIFIHSLAAKEHGKHYTSW